jgi:hypothetical protein
MRHHRGGLLVHLGNLGLPLPGLHWTVWTFRCRCKIEGHYAGTPGLLTQTGLLFDTVSRLAMLLSAHVIGYQN